MGYSFLAARLYLHLCTHFVFFSWQTNSAAATDQNPNEGANKTVKPVALIVRCLLTVVSVVTRQFGSVSIYLFMLIQNSLVRTVFNTPKTCHMKLGEE